MTTQVPRPWGLTRMRPFPVSAVVTALTVVLDPESQTGSWSGSNGQTVPSLDRHKRSETSAETATRTSLDGTSDEGSDQQGDTD